MWKTTFLGSLGRDAEMKQVGDGQCCSFSVAVNYFEKSEKQTAWIDVSLFGGRAEKVAPLLVKGTKVVVTGSMKLRTYKTTAGETKTVPDVRADDVEIAQFADHGQGPPAGGGGGYGGGGMGSGAPRGRY